jgi:hypothetical protein
VPACLALADDTHEAGDHIFLQRGLFMPTSGGVVFYKIIWFAYHVYFIV